MRVRHIAPICVAAMLLSVLAWSAFAASGGPDRGERTVVQPRAGVEPSGEVPADGPSTSPEPGEPGFRLPGVSQGKPPAFLIDKAPASAFSKGALVGKFPRGHFPLPNGTRVLSSEITSEGTQVRAFVEGSCRCTVDEVLAVYDESASKLRFRGSKGPAVGRSRAHFFQDDNDFVTVTTRAEGSSVTFFVVLILTAARR